ncbi:hypothetical protein DUI87_05683 [Hirundo rustica rustica]|uniref:Uncharacterized protein n=1 Tax=Hirundo rustica rustica TaxID=333673 RepID=A0A3M0KWB8_HIRRU|nr:hypothetical protein DUI87_05683 [Hirundo rustica rustica]
MNGGQEETVTFTCPNSRLYKQSNPQAQLLMCSAYFSIEIRLQEVVSRATVTQTQSGSGVFHKSRNHLECLPQEWDDFSCLLMWMWLQQQERQYYIKAQAQDENIMDSSIARSRTTTLNIPRKDSLPSGTHKTQSEVTLFDALFGESIWLLTVHEERQFCSASYGNQVCLAAPGLIWQPADKAVLQISGQALMDYNDIISFSVLVTKLKSLGSWGRIHPEWIGSLVLNVEGISGLALEFFPSSSHTHAQEWLFWHMAPLQASAVAILEKASTIKDWTRDDGLKLKEGGFGLDIRKKLFTVRVLENESPVFCFLDVQKPDNENISTWSIKRVADMQGWIALLKPLVPFLSDPRCEENHRITEYAELEWTHKDHRVQLLALLSTIPKNPTLC